MEKNLYIDASHPNETRIVLKSDNSIEEYEFEDKNNLNFKNDIYLGTINLIIINFHLKIKKRLELQKKKSEKNLKTKQLILIRIIHKLKLSTIKMRKMKVRLKKTIKNKNIEKKLNLHSV